MPRRGSTGTADDGSLAGIDGAPLFVFVLCDVCTKYISDEGRHTCELTWAQQHERDARRAAKIAEIVSARKPRSTPAATIKGPR